MTIAEALETISLPTAEHANYFFVLQLFSKLVTSSSNDMQQQSPSSFETKLGEFLYLLMQV
jgi:hypothetical protein